MVIIPVIMFVVFMFAMIVFSSRLDGTKLCDKVMVDGKYLITIYKHYYDNISGEDFYTYQVVIKTLDNKEALFEYMTYWLDYKYKFHGDIDFIIKYSIGKYEDYLKERKYINKKETEFITKTERETK